MTQIDHWTNVYTTKDASSVSWYQQAPTPSLRALDRLGVDRSAALIDIGGGASKLVDALLKQGWPDLTVLDIAESALDVAKARLGPDATKVNWEAADITTWTPQRRYEVWHDRAVFHFLTEPAQRNAYRSALAQGLAHDGMVVIATFALDGPDRCSGLEVQRYDAAGLAAEMGDNFELVDSWQEQHITPGGNAQAFNWCVFRRR